MTNWAWAIIHYDHKGRRVGSNPDDIYEDGWFVDFIGDETGTRQKLVELQSASEGTIQFILLKAQPGYSYTGVEVK